jgi:hypothetical protein
MSRSFYALVLLSALAPLSVDAPGDSSTDDAPGGETRIVVGGGYGEYAFITRGCEGQVIDRDFIHFVDAGAGAEHRFAGTPLVLGVRGGWLRDDLESTVTRPLPEGFAANGERENRYVNPHVALEREGMGMGLGWVGHDREFVTAGEGAREQSDHALNDLSGHLRLGNLERKYFSIEWMESVPLYSDGGYLTIGLGGRMPHRALHLHGGLAAGGPYEGAGVLIRANYRLAPGVEARLGARLGYSGDADASGVTLGARLTR